MSKKCSDIFFMNLALVEAKKAYNLNEVPVGAVIVYKNRVIGTGFNCKEKNNNALNHAELLAISAACGKLKSWRLNNCTMYVTMEPCMMCMGAILESRISRVVYGISSKYEQMYLNGKIDFESGILEKKCLDLMQDFFKNIRK